MTRVWLAIQDLMTSHACMPRTNLCFFSSPILAAHFNLDLSNPQIANIDLIIFNKFSCQKAALLQLPSSRERNHLSPFSDFLISLLPRDLHPHWTRLTLQLSYWFYRFFSNSFFLRFNIFCIVCCCPTSTLISTGWDDNFSSKNILPMKIIK